MVRQGCRLVLEECVHDDAGSFVVVVEAVPHAVPDAGHVLGSFDGRRHVATSIALSLWVTLHGLVTLELAGALGTAAAETAFRSAIPAALRGWASPEAAT